MKTFLEARTEFTDNLKNMSMLSIIEWFAWNDRNGEFDDMTFDEAVEIALTWFEDMKDLGESRHAFLLSTENN